jgi:hypothetical protein
MPPRKGKSPACRPLAVTHGEHELRVEGRTLAASERS